MLSKINRCLLKIANTKIFIILAILGIFALIIFVDEKNSKSLCSEWLKKGTPIEVHSLDVCYIVRLLLDKAESIAIVAGVILFFQQIPERKNRKHYESWQIIDNASGAQSSTSYARKIALKVLWEDGESLKGIDVSDADLTEMDLSEADLNEATLTEADLSNAKLMEANLVGATLVKAILVNTNLARADLSGADLSGADLSGADLTGATLTGATLTKAILRNAILRDADLNGATLTKAILTGANLTGANLESTNIDEIVDLDEKWYLVREIINTHPRNDLSNRNGVVDIQQCHGSDLSNTNLSGANLSNTNLSKANLSNTNLSEANLSNTNLSEANLSGADFRRANLSNTNLSEANLSGADFRRANLSGVALEKATNLREARNLPIKYSVFALIKHLINNITSL